jgi:hypothetical protein
MTLYEVFADGWHTPLTAEQIAELFRAGRLKGEDWCRNRASASWRTLDEVFPALKHQSETWSMTHARDNIPAVPLAVGVAALILATLGFALLQSYRSSTSAYVEKAQRRWSPKATEFLRIDSNQSGKAGFAMERTQQPVSAREQAQREQAVLAEQMRVEMINREREQAKRAGREEIIPLNQFVTIPNVGGAPIQLKIVDNDVASFDAWVNGAHLHNVKKQKGISHSGTDETLIYENRYASLYYVWEISGTLDSCLLRIREY